MNNKKEEKKKFHPPFSFLPGEQCRRLEAPGGSSTGGHGAWPGAGSTPGYSIPLSSIIHIHTNI